MALPWRSGVQFLPLKDTCRAQRWSLAESWCSPGSLGCKYAKCPNGESLAGSSQDHQYTGFCCAIIALHCISLYGIVCTVEHKRRVIADKNGISERILPSEAQLTCPHSHHFLLSLLLLFKKQSKTNPNPKPPNKARMSWPIFPCEPINSHICVTGWLHHGRTCDCQRVGALEIGFGGNKNCKKTY